MRWARKHFFKFEIFHKYLSGFLDFLKHFGCFKEELVIFSIVYVRKNTSANIGENEWMVNAQKGNECPQWKQNVKSLQNGICIVIRHSQTKLLSYAKNLRHLLRHIENCIVKSITCQVCLQNREMRQIHKKWKIVANKQKMALSEKIVLKYPAYFQIFWAFEENILRTSSFCNYFSGP